MSEFITKSLPLPSMAWLTVIERSTLERYARTIRASYGDRIHKMVLFGSRVRGEGSEESDIDVAVIMTMEDSNLRRELYDIATTLWIETEIRISPLVFSKGEYDRLLQMKRGIVVAIHDEGVPL